MLSRLAPLCGKTKTNKKRVQLCPRSLKAWAEMRILMGDYHFCSSYYHFLFLPSLFRVKANLYGVLNGCVWVRSDYHKAFNCEV